MGKVNPRTDQDLLRAYAEENCEASFAQLAARHLELVYSAALRMVRDDHLAKDVTQATFLALAVNAGKLLDRPALGGWLHRTAQNLASKMVRSEVKRRLLEQESATVAPPMAEKSESNWEEIAPQLDLALGELAEGDREVVLLRYFQRKSARESASILGISEEAAQRRVSRAVQRLRDLLMTRGARVEVAGLILLITAKGVEAAPAGLGLAVSSAMGVAQLAMTKSVAKGSALKIMAGGMLKPAVVSGVLIMTAMVMVSQKVSQNRNLKLDNADLAARAVRLELESGKLKKQVIKLTGELQRKPSQPELLQLRNEVGMLRGADRELARFKEEEKQRELQKAQSLVSNEIRTLITPPSETAQGTELLFSKSIKVESEKFVRAMELEFTGARAGIPDLVTNASSFNGLIHAFFETHHIKLAPPKAIFFNRRSGIILIRATPDDFNQIMPLLTEFGRE